MDYSSRQEVRKKSKLLFLWKFSSCRPYFVSVINISLLSSLFGDFFLVFQDNIASLKQAPGHNHENTIFQPGCWQSLQAKSSKIFWPLSVINQIYIDSFFVIILNILEKTLVPAWCIKSLNIHYAEVSFENINHLTDQHHKTICNKLIITINYSWSALCFLPKLSAARLCFLISKFCAESIQETYMQFSSNSWVCRRNAIVWL